MAWSLLEWEWCSKLPAVSDILVPLRSGGVLPSSSQLSADVDLEASAAKALGVSRKTLSCIINGKAGISPEMAVRLSIAFNTSSESWVNQQAQFDLWQAEQHRHELKVTPLSAV